MKYMLLIYMNEQAMNQAEREQCFGESTRLCHDLAAEGKFLGAGPLHPVSTATSVRVQGGQRLVTSGPSAETHEQLGGYYLIDAKDLDDAIAIATRIPPVSKGTVEIRPMFELSGLPAKA